MATAIPFKEQNTTAEIGQNDPAKVYPMACWSGVCLGDPTIISCWKLGPQELEEINRTGVIWQGILGQFLPPSWITGHNPFTVYGPGQCGRCGKPVHDDRAGQLCLPCQRSGDLPLPRLEGFYVYLTDTEGLSIAGEGLGKGGAEVYCEFCKRSPLTSCMVLAWDKDPVPALAVGHRGICEPCLRRATAMFAKARQQLT